MSSRYRVLTPAAARELLRIAGEAHRQGHEKVLPPEILELRRRIARETRNAELFFARTGAVDNGMVYLVVDLKLELDRLYGELAERGANELIA